MLDRILDQWLQQHARHHHIERRWIEFLYDTQLLTAKADDFDVEIVIDKLEFFAQRSERLAAVQQPSQNGGQLEDHVASRIWIEAHQRRNRIQRIEQKVRVDLVLQRLHTSVQQKALLLLQFDLNPDTVEDFDLDSDCGHGRGIDQPPYPKVVTFDTEDPARKIASDCAFNQTQSNNCGEEHDLPVKQARTRQVTANQSEDTLIDEGRKRPDIVLISSHRAKLSGKKTREHMKRHRSPFSVDERRQTDNPTTQRACPAAAEHSQHHRCLKTDIAGLEAILRDADQNAEYNRHAEPESKVHLLPKSTFFPKQQRLKVFGTYQSARHGGSHAQLDQQINQDETWFHE